MKSMEEEIWEYIDGDISAQDKATIAAKIAADAAYAAVYMEMLELNQLLAVSDLEEPSMSFTRNLMDKISLEPAPVTLKTQVDKRIIYSLSAVFLLAILSVSWFAVSNADFSGVALPSFNFNIDLQQVVNPLTLQLFVFIDIVLGLLYLDRLYRSNKNPH